jgi:hypothetical protein
MPKVAEEPSAPGANRRQASDLLFSAWLSHENARRAVVHECQKRCQQAYFDWIGARDKIYQVAWMRLQEAYHALVIATNTPGAAVEAVRQAYLQAQSEFQFGADMRDQFAQAYDAYTAEHQAALKESEKALEIVESDYLKAFKKGVGSIDPDALEADTLCSLRLAVSSVTAHAGKASPDKKPITAAAS